MKVAKNEGLGGERLTVKSLADRLVIVRPHATGEMPTKFSDGELVRWVDCHAWFVGNDGTPTPIGANGATALRVWPAVLTPPLAVLMDEFVAARIIKPGNAFVFDELSPDEVRRCEEAERALMVSANADDAF